MRYLLIGNAASIFSYAAAPAALSSMLLPPMQVIHEDVIQWYSRRVDPDRRCASTRTPYYLFIGLRKRGMFEA
jgi:hypothetical protein